MPIVLNFKDENRLRILKALFKKGSIKPNLEKISAATSLSVTEIKKSLKNLEDNFGLDFFYPELNPEKTGFNIHGWVFMQIDLTKRDIFDKLLDFFDEETEIFIAHRIIGSGKWNFAIRFISKSLEEFDALINEKTLSKVDGANQIILDKEYIFFKEPTFKNIGRSFAVIHELMENNDQKFSKRTPKNINEKVFSYLESGECIKPNIRQINRITGIHSSTIKSTLDYFNANKIITKYSPGINFSKAKIKFFVFDFLDVDLTDVELVKALQEAVTKDKNLFHAGSIFANPYHNFIFIQAYNSMDSYQKNFEDKYSAIAKISSNRETFFTTTFPFETKGDWPTPHSAILKTLIRDSGKDI